LARHKPDQMLTLFHQIKVVGPGSIPFQEGKLRQVQATSFPAPEAFANLIDLVPSGRDQPLHTDFRRRMKEPIISRFGVKVEFGGQGRNAMGRLDLDVACLPKKLA